MRFAVYDTRFGKLLVKYNDQAITYFSVTNDFIADYGTRSSVSDLAYHQFEDYLNGKRFSLDFPIEYHGTAFQEKVWEALKTIPYGEIRSYAQIAQQIGHPKAYRAVGQANHNNPLIIIIPCHRVIGSSGKSVGYACGLEMKNELIALEKRYKTELK